MPTGYYEWARTRAGLYVWEGRLPNPSMREMGYPGTTEGEGEGMIVLLLS